MKKVTKITLAALGGVLLAFGLMIRPTEGRRRPSHKHVPKANSRSSHRAAQANKELSRINAEIAKYEKELRDHEAQEAKSKKHLKAFDARSRQLQQTIARLKAEAEELASEKSEVDTELTHTASKLDRMRSEYARGVRYLYESGVLRQHDESHYLLNPDRADSSIRMRYYAQAIGRAHRATGTQLDSMKAALGLSSHELAGSIAAEQQAIGQRASEAQTIEQHKAEEAKQLAQIQARKERLKQLLAERRASAKKLEGIIAGLVSREERATRERATRKNRRSRSPAPEEEIVAGPAHGPHSLNWPTSSHHIVQGFGEHRNAELNTVTMNLGIDISATRGSSVLAAAEGVISIVSSLPSYGTIVVVKHTGGLHTVYADLAAANVHAGERVHAGQSIGRSGSNEENGPVLHFEVWKGRAKQNPLGWLR
ncbi:MAG: peptidoglycan DD-metalloendopeptidase family protein [Bacteroidota bacterium]|nr:peptidoglycan DD-metalloendopeptidase family protein [Bacteroidota bacterium]MDP4234009.1 peptidoglycan DD-metalloendopeptidase family protein [Bacteroidota bacterium]MDP4242876.1 peptidoglycan DD-metalloendopeptidase family protein [Bacteroidota bacterium]MDP4287686.1 peptidoglycan DD-metalloendopeptidase family protein [Bacteroidota bacterium]